MNINNPARLATLLEHIKILPRRLWLDTPGVEASVPMLRGVWGAALHEVDGEAYREVFGGDESAGAPPQYLLRPAPPDPRLAPAVDFFLFGRGPQYDRACRLAWQEAAGRGLGPRRRPFSIRGAFVLGPDGTISEEPRAAADSVGNGAPSGPCGVPEIASAGRATAADGTPQRAFATGEADGTRSVPATLAWPLSQAVWPLPPLAPCRLVFRAPLRLRRRGSLVEQPTLADLVVAACRRIEALLPDACRDDWKNHSAAALETARAAPQSVWQGARLDLHRWSARQQNELDLHGVSGALDLPEGPGELAPLLAAAHWLHLGKGTVMGLGQFEVVGG
ncbi:MAG TPA: CRISPR system precrRNA processing endoribonuclease RAMP protein Cas6 [Pirellulales bacterium]|nr:CRISPR system precrRNA processing endoribonuclease RAMP protein Cas6 [Pirellulales bacterium]